MDRTVGFHIQRQGASSAMFRAVVPLLQTIAYAVYPYHDSLSKSGTSRKSESCMEVDPPRKRVMNHLEKL